jgi:hypothetical protein
VATKYRIPDPNRRMFTHEIEDDQPFRSEKENPGEYGAWTEVLRFLHDQKFTAAELEQNARRDLTIDDLTVLNSRTKLRLSLTRFDGKLTKIRKIKPTRAVAAAGVTQMYEGWLIPADDAQNRSVCIALLELPPGLAADTVNEWVPVDQWVSFAGYFFKLLAHPAPGTDPADRNAGRWLASPLLVGRSVTLLVGPPTAEIKLNRDLRIFEGIEDDSSNIAQNRTWEERVSWNRVLFHARRFSVDQLEAAANRDLTFSDLFRETRLRHKLELVYVEGRLVRLRKGEPDPQLVEAGVANWYEGWLIPHHEPRGNPMCIMMSELPDGLEPQPAGSRLMNRRVSFAGYYFKLMRYETPEVDDQKQNVIRRSPLLIGRSVVLREAEREWSWGTTFVPGVVAGVILLAATALGLSWWFRRGDRKVHKEIQSVRHKNPFDGSETVS